ncbi:MAG: HAD hydrolase-like protein, partial [Thermoplasmata archaeon]|nr:HAD hydrolase-like protein [Thermoplasmata archaeon]
MPAARRKGKRTADPAPAVEPPEADAPPTLLPLMSAPTSQFAEVSRIPTIEAPVDPVQVERGVVVFDLDGTLLDDIGLISHVAADALFRAFGTPVEEGRVHYLATTGMPFEAQLSQLYPDVPVDQRNAVARIFHERKIKEAYSAASVFPDVPRLLKRLGGDGWTLVVSTGAEREMADLVLEREGIRYWFEGILGSGQGTKKDHLREYRRRYPEVPVYLVGDSRFDMEAAAATPGVTALGRASSFPGWQLTPDDLKRGGATW